MERFVGVSVALLGLGVLLGSSPTGAAETAGQAPQDVAVTFPVIFATPLRAVVGAEDSLAATEHFFLTEMQGRLRAKVVASPLGEYRSVESKTLSTLYDADPGTKDAKLAMDLQLLAMSGQDIADILKAAKEIDQDIEQMMGEWRKSSNEREAESPDREQADSRRSRKGERMQMRQSKDGKPAHLVQVTEVTVTFSGVAGKAGAAWAKPEARRAKVEMHLPGTVRKVQRQSNELARGQQSKLTGPPSVQGEVHTPRLRWVRIQTGMPALGLGTRDHQSRRRAR